MIIEVKVPSPGESVTQVQLANWLVTDGDVVEKDTEIAEIDSDKATLSVSAPESGRIRIEVAAGETVEVGTIIARIDASVVPEEKKTDPAGSSKSVPSPLPEIKPVTQAVENRAREKDATESEIQEKGIHISPLARKLMAENNFNETDLLSFLKDYRISREDILFVAGERQKTETMAQNPVSKAIRETETKKMSTLRMKLSERLVAVKNQTAMLTTFNEVNMTPVFEMRKKYKDAFKEKFNVSLGFMSFFTKAVSIALKDFPEVNARIEGDSIVYHRYADIGIAVSAPKGLMVPVLRNAERMTMAEIEMNIKELADKARKGKITIDEMEGGTFTITNGGVFGSMLSTPILNPPQSAILGMHNIVERPIAVNGKVEIHPVMYIAMSYDHRVIDGRESVGFVVRVKEMLENPVRMLTGGKDPGKILLGLD